VLFEREERLGGRARLAGRAPFRGSWLEYADYLDRLLAEEPRVAVRGGEEATALEIAASEPDLVVVAVGAQTRVDAVADTIVLSPDELLGSPRRAAQWRHAVVVDQGGRWDAVNAVDVLLDIGAEPVYVTERERVAHEVVEDSRFDIVERLERRGVAAYTSAALAHGASGLTVRERRQRRTTPLPRVDGVVWAGPLESNAPPRGLEELGCPLLLVGDALSPRGLRTATTEGAAVVSLFADEAAAR
jgi:hypothetical protein